MSHQDWTPVIFKKNTKPKTTHYQITHEKIDSNEIIKLKVISPEKSKEIRDLRNSKKVSQKDLAKSLNIKLDIIQDIENGTHQHNGNLFARIINHLKSIQPMPLS